MAFNFFNFKRDNQTREVDETQPQQTLQDVLLSRITGGGELTRAQALTIPAVNANIDFIANCVACMPVKLYKRENNKIVEVIGDNRTTLLNYDTGDTLDAYQFKHAMIEDYFLSSGAYAYIKKRLNTVTGLYYVENDNVCINQNFKPIYKDYSITIQEATYRPFDFLKLLRNTTDGATGQSIIKELSTALENAYQTQLYSLGLVKSGGNKRGFLRAERKIGADEVAALKTAWRNMYANNKESVVVLNNGLDFKEAANTSVEMQLNESTNTLKEQIDKIFHITEDFNQTFKFAVLPVVKAFENALNRDLLLEIEKDQYFFAFDFTEIIKADIKERFEVYKTAKECQMFTINELRQMENKNEIAGGDVIDFGLAAVLFDVKTQKYFTPNTGEISDTTENTSGVNDNEN